MQASISAMLNQFRDHVPDQGSLLEVADLAADPEKWPDAHDLFDRVRRRNLEAIESGVTSVSANTALKRPV